MFRFYLLLFVLPSFIFGQQTYVPDDNFEQALIVLGYDTPPLNDSVPTKNIENVRSLWIFNEKISDLTGIEDFISLEYLTCSHNQIEVMNLSQNLKLKELECHHNKLKTIDLSSNDSLFVLLCGSNELESLDLTNNRLLRSLYCESNSIEVLTLNSNLMLEILMCPENKLTDLDLSRNPKIKYIWCGKNNLSFIDVSQNNSLQSLYCSENKLSKLNLSNNDSLTFLTCSFNNLIELDLSNNLLLKELKCDNNQIMELNLSKNTEIGILLCYLNDLRHLNIRNGRNFNFTNGANQTFKCQGNPNLFCIQVDDSSWSDTTSKWHKDDHAIYSEDCSLINSIEEETNPNKDIPLSPNPARDYIEINNVILSETKDPEILVYNVLGGKLMDSRLRRNDILVSSEGKVRIDISSLSPGLYFVSVGGRMYKFVKL